MAKAKPAGDQRGRNLIRLFLVPPTQPSKTVLCGYEWFDDDGKRSSVDRVTARQPSAAPRGLVIGLLCAAATGAEGKHTALCFDASWVLRPDLDEATGGLRLRAPGKSTWLSSLANAFGGESNKAVNDFRDKILITNSGNAEPWWRAGMIQGDTVGVFTCHLPPMVLDSQSTNFWGPELRFRLQGEKADIASEKELLNLARQYEQVGVSKFRWAQTLEPQVVELPEAYRREGDRHKLTLGAQIGGSQLGQALAPRTWWQEEVTAFLQRHANRDIAPPYLQLVAGPYFGKSWFAWQLAHESALFGRRPIFHCFRRGDSRLDNVADARRLLFDQLARQYGLSDRVELTQSDFLDALRMVRRQLTRGQVQLIIIDGLDETFGPRSSHAPDKLAELLPRPDDLSSPGVAFFLTTRPEAQLHWQKNPDHCATIAIPDKSPEFACRFVPEVEAALEAINPRLPRPAPVILLPHFAQRSGGYLGLCLKFHLGTFGQARWKEWEAHPNRIPGGVSDVLEEIWDSLLTRYAGRLPELRASLLWPALVAEPQTEHEAAALLHCSTQVAGQIARPPGQTLCPPDTLTADVLRTVWTSAGELFLADRRPDRRWQYFHTTVPEFLLRRLDRPPSTLPTEAEVAWWKHALARACVLAGADANNPAQAYALRHGVRHLLEAGLLGEAVDWLRDSKVLDTCDKVFPTEPELALQHLSTALAGAVVAEDVRNAAWLTLEHARRIEQVRQMTPFEAWENTKTQDWKTAWEYAWRVAECDAIPDRGMCWKLWLIRELDRTGRSDAATAARQRLGQAAYRRWTGPFEKLRKALLNVGETLMDSMHEAPSIYHGGPEVTHDEWSQGLNVAQGIEDDQKRAAALSTLFSGLAETDDPQGDRLIKAMNAAAIIESGWYRVEVLSALFAVLASVNNPQAGHRLDRVLKAARALEDEWCRAEALSALSPVLAAANDPQAGHRLAQALKAAREIRDGWSRAKALGALFPVLAAAKDPQAGRSLDEALLAARSIEKKISRDKALSDLFPVLAKADDPLAGNRLDVALKAESAIWDECHRAEAMRDMFTVLALANYPQSGYRLDKALETVRLIGEEWYRAEAMSALFPQLAFANDPQSGDRLDKALDAARAIGEEQARANALRALFSVLAAANDPNSSRRLDEALDAAQAIESDCYRTKALIALFPVLAVANDPQSGNRQGQALKAARGIKVGWGRAEALGALFPILAAAKDTQAVLCLDEALEDARVVEHEVVPGESLAALIPVLAVANDPQAGHRLRQALKAARGIKNQWGRAKALGALFPVLAAANDPQAVLCLDDAMKAARGIRGEWGRAKALGILFPVLAKASDPRASSCLDEALAAAQAIESEESRSWVLLDLFSELAKANDPRASSCLDEALAAAQAIESEASRSYRLRALLPVLAAAKDPEARRRLDEALKAVRAIGVGQLQYWALSALLPVRAEAENPSVSEAVSDFIKALRQHNLGTSLLSEISRELSELDRRQALPAVLILLEFSGRHLHTALAALLALAKLLPEHRSDIAKWLGDTPNKPPW
jgi:hypothetical protein